MRRPRLLLQAAARTGLIQVYPGISLPSLRIGSCGKALCTRLERSAQVVNARLLVQASGGQKARVVVRGVGVGRVVKRWPVVNYYNPYYYG